MGLVALIKHDFVIVLGIIRLVGRITAQLGAFVLAVHFDQLEFFQQKGDPFLDRFRLLIQAPVDGAHLQHRPGFGNRDVVDHDPKAVDVLEFDMKQVIRIFSLVIIQFLLGIGSAVMFLFPDLFRQYLTVIQHCTPPCRLL